jgi:dehydration protein DpgD
MDLKHVIYTKQGQIATVMLNRPEAANAINRKMRQELSEIWEEFKADDALWIAVLTGAGDKSFCVGLDHSDQAPKKTQPSLSERDEGSRVTTAKQRHKLPRRSLRTTSIL